MISNVNTENKERVSGFPKPELYDQHYINKYSFPKALVSNRSAQAKSLNKTSIYDVQAPLSRKGVNGWKLTKAKPTTNYYEETYLNDYKRPTPISSDRLATDPDQLPF
eukprot:CAMPEP_0176400194 /NCGR_PEP_ID=MMETSP0126-20121128/47404_1 /TAXON_ID=141414 ORGANISM="Strombidinopsis acuminatum, Strain SPMC142" /NCGR_SAMPLE_ID=MMETSP0126 /ASSEMBLY_ACC=CAM_ASM_000229 /LENGTH=107 /DNA_ID=CAMNT_0017776307 /DNA_START=330 /DNA_END=653 /DNA_ORIENTATION=-